MDSLLQENHFCNNFNWNKGLHQSLMVDLLSYWWCVTTGDVNRKTRSASSRRFVEHMDSLLQEKKCCNNFNWNKGLHQSLMVDPLSYWCNKWCVTTGDVNRKTEVRAVTVSFNTWILCWRKGLWFDGLLHQSLAVNSLSYFLVNKCCGTCYPVCRMMHIKEPLLLIGKSSPCGSSGFPFSLSEWFFIHK